MPKNPIDKSLYVEMHQNKKLYCRNVNTYKSSMMYDTTYKYIDHLKKNIDIDMDRFKSNVEKNKKHFRVKTLVINNGKITNYLHRIFSVTPEDYQYLISNYPELEPKLYSKEDERNDNYCNY